MPVSKAQQKANAKYNAKAYDRIEVKVLKGEKAIIKDFATSKGESLNNFVKTAIEERIAKG